MCKGKFQNAFVSVLFKILTRWKKYMLTYIVVVDAYLSLYCMLKSIIINFIVWWFYDQSTVSRLQGNILFFVHMYLCKQVKRVLRIRHIQLIILGQFLRIKISCTFFRLHHIDLILYLRIHCLLCKLFDS